LQGVSRAWFGGTVFHLQGEDIGVIGVAELALLIVEASANASGGENDDRRLRKTAVDRVFVGISTVKVAFSDNSGYFSQVLMLSGHFSYAPVNFRVNPWQRRQ
jgi:hypothetical protein